MLVSPLVYQGKKYLLSDYNRDGDSHRSPWNNKYDPPVSDGFVPSAALREMEVEANLLFDTYRELYFDGGNSSVYFWDLDGSGFAACFLVKKVTEGGENVKMGSWDGIFDLILWRSIKPPLFGKMFPLFHRSVPLRKLAPPQSNSFTSSHLPSC